MFRTLSKILTLILFAGISSSLAETVNYSSGKKIISATEFKGKMFAHSLRLVALANALRGNEEFRKAFPRFKELEPHWDSILRILSMHDRSKWDDSPEFTRAHDLPAKGNGSVAEVLAADTRTNYNSLTYEEKVTKMLFKSRFNSVDESIIGEMIHREGLAHFEEEIRLLEEVVDRPERYLAANQKAKLTGVRVSEEFGKEMVPSHQYIQEDTSDLRSAGLKKKIGELSNITESLDYENIVAGLDDETILQRLRHTSMDKIRDGFLARTRILHKIKTFGRNVSFRRLPSKPHYLAKQRGLGTVTRKVLANSGILSVAAGVASSLDSGNFDFGKFVDEMLSIGDAHAMSVLEDLATNNPSFFTNYLAAYDLKEQLRLRKADSGLDRNLEQSAAAKITILQKCTPHQIDFTMTPANGASRKVELHLNAQGTPSHIRIFDEASTSLKPLYEVPERTLRQGQLGNLNSNQKWATHYATEGFASLKACCESQCLAPEAPEGFEGKKAVTPAKTVAPVKSGADSFQKAEAGYF